MIRFLAVSNLNQKVMNAKGGNSVFTDQDSYYGSASEIKWLVIRFTVSGILVSVLWLSLFVAGLLVDSSYYRAAISFKFAGLNDWILAIITFTFSNVVLLAFTSGLLGGISSKLHYTKGFEIARKEYEEANSFQIENPFLSAFRGMFVFIAILFMQYVSSFADLGAISKIPDEEKKSTEIKFEKLFSTIAENDTNTIFLREVRSKMDKLMASGNIVEPDTSLINRIIMFKADLRELSRKDTLNDIEKEKKKYKESRIKAMRGTIKVPSNSDFSGIGLTSFSYFKFAVIVSFLAFMCGYDPSLFKVLIGKVLTKPGITDPPEDAKNKKLTSSEKELKS